MHPRASLPAHAATEFGRGVADDLLEDLREVEHVAEAEFVREFLEPVGALVDRRTSAFDPADFLEMCGAASRPLRELLAEVFITEADAARHFPRMYPFVLYRLTEQMPAVLEPQFGGRAFRLRRGGKQVRQKVQEPSHGPQFPCGPAQRTRREHFIEPTSPVLHRLRTPDGLRGIEEALPPQQLELRSVEDNVDLAPTRVASGTVRMGDLGK